MEVALCPDAVLNDKDLESIIQLYSRQRTEGMLVRHLMNIERSESMKDSVTASLTFLDPLRILFVIRADCNTFYCPQEVLYTADEF